MRARSKCSLKKCLAQIQTTWRNVTYLILEGEKCSLMKVLWGHEPSKPSSGKESGMFSGSTPEEYGILCLKLYLLLVCTHIMTQLMRTS